MRATVGVVGLLLLLSGCIGMGDEGVPNAGDIVENTGELKLKPIVAPEVPEVRTPQAAPKWRMGEWWTYRLTDQFTGQAYEFQRIVTGIEGDNYLVGMPAGAFRNAIMVLHIPGFGEVDSNDLSYEIHDFRFEPLRFPLTQGDRWESAFEGPAIEVEVVSVSETKAELQARPLPGSPAQYMNITYDAELGEISRLAIDGYATYEVVDHGVGYDGLVTVPHMHDIIFQHFRLGPTGSGGVPVVPGLPPLQPNPSDTVQVDSTYDRVSFAIIMGTVLPDTSSPQGYYSLQANAPSGVTYSNTITPADSPGLKIWFYQDDQPGGAWTFNHVAAGPGITLAEGIAYHVYDIEMPSGKVLASTGEHQHGS